MAGTFNSLFGQDLNAGVWEADRWGGGGGGVGGVRNRRLYISTFEALLPPLGVAGRDNGYLKLFTLGK